MSYAFTVENAEQNVSELFPLYCRHYAEMQARLEQQGLEVSPFAPRLERYFQAAREGYLLNFVVRTESGEAVGYSNIYLTNSMHNGDFLAREDTIFVLKEHRNGVGRRFSKFILDHLHGLGVKQLHVTALTDLRVVNLWKRMGFKEVGVAMAYEFKDYKS